MEMCEGEKFDAVCIKFEGSGGHLCDTLYLKLTGRSLEARYSHDIREAALVVSWRKQT